MKKFSSNQEYFDHLLTEYTPQEIAESYLLSAEPNPNPKITQAEHEEFLRLRFEALRNMTPEQRLMGNLMMIQVQVQDYLKAGRFEEAFSFPNQLRRYLGFTGKTQQELAADLGLHKSRLSRVLNGRERPNVELMYRLERHSNDYLPAHYWWGLHALELEHQLRHDDEKRTVEAAKVRNVLRTESRSAKSKAAS